MTIREILTAPDPRLREKSKPVEVVTDEIRTLMDDMLETMYNAPGIGLAAIQVGVPLRVIVIEEGCLSVPEFYDEVERPETCVVEYLNRDGELQRLEAEGLLAVCIQHEMDHLEGVLFIDHLSRLKRDRIIRKLKKEQRMAATG